MSTTTKPGRMFPGSLRSARLLALAAILFACVLLPVCMTVANKSSPLLLGVGAALANLAAFRGGFGRKLLGKYLSLLDATSGRLVLVAIGLAVASLIWSIDRALTTRGLREALPEIVFAWSFAAAGSCIFRRRDPEALGYGLILAAAAILLEATFGMPLHHLFGTRAEPYDLKWSALTLAVLLWPAIGGLRQQAHRALPIAVVASTAAAAIAAHSSTALCAIGFSTVLFGLASFAQRATLFALAAVLFTALIVPPWFGQLAGALITPENRARLEQQHAEHRIEIWTSFGRRVGEQFLFGHGFNTSFRIARPEHPEEASIIASHPHNAFLQVWVEFGVVGVVGLGLALAHIIRRLGTFSARQGAVRIALLGTVAILALVWENPWRPWWLAALGLALALFAIERETADTDELAEAGPPVMDEPLLG